MSGESPKLFTNKPKKAQLKQAQPSPPPPPPPSAASSSSSSAAAAAASYSVGAQAQNPPPPPPPPPPAKQPFGRLYKFLWPLLLAVNFAVGAYLFTRTQKKDTDTGDKEESKDAISTSVSSSVTSTASVADKSPSAPPVIQPVIKREPIPPSQQRELCKWMLEEKRKIKPKDDEERKRIDEEKAILKQFIRAKSLPNL